jgi:hypothetical protein
VSGETTAIAVQHETALVRSIDLRTGTAADGDAAWAVLLFGAAFFLVATAFLFVWVRSRVRKAAAALVPARVSSHPLRTPSAADQLDPFPV